ncbi:MAG TPA: HlyD family efflux transporter periplasmic adaptor subunit [Arachidicoccus sp.]|nr:HlyD family efflux transporter periplasmic adaptor subunit [Arachidicoccus sp.]
MKSLITSIILFFTLLYSSCKTNGDTRQVALEESSVTPVTITQPVIDTLSEIVNLNAVSAFLLKSDVKANINGYIIRGSLHVGSRIQKGQVLFVLETKEARSLGNTINQLDSTFRFSGVNYVRSPVTGFLTMLNHQPGDYVQDGETLGSITDNRSFGFMLDLPYEYHGLLSDNKDLDIILPDGKILNGTVIQQMPSVDSSSQTQKIWIKPSGSEGIPENLIAKVELVKQRYIGLALPRAALFSDENQAEFWVMQLINDSTAVKIAVQKGIENDSLVAIKAPQFNLKDTFIVNGGYGLPDSAKVKVLHAAQK